MKQPLLHSFRRPQGMTLIEVTIALGVTMGLAVASMAMLSQQLSFTRMVQNQTFLLEDCPSINNTLTRMLGRVDSYRIYPDLAGARAGGAAVITGGNAMLLSYRDSLDRINRLIVAAEDLGNGRIRLGVYRQNGNTWGTEPDWVISNQAAAADFFVENGVLRVRLTGPNDEQITYSGHTQS